jgi:3-isopropylmalate dehydrogenase
MWRWLGHRHTDADALAAGERIEAAVRIVMAEKGATTPDLGGKMTTHELGSAIADACN